MIDAMFLLQHPLRAQIMPAIAAFVFLYLRHHTLEGYIGRFTTMRGRFQVSSCALLLYFSQSVEYFNYTRQNQREGQGHSYRRGGPMIEEGTSREKL